MKRNLPVFLIVCLLIIFFACSYEDDPPAATPVAIPPGGHHFPPGGGEVRLTCATPEATIFYIINDGPETAYTGPILFTEDVTIKAVARRMFWNDSEMLVASYTVEEDDEEDDEGEE